MFWSENGMMEVDFLVEQFCMLTRKVQGWLWDWVCCGDEVKVSGTEEVKELCDQDLWTLSIPILRSTRMGEQNYNQKSEFSVKARGLDPENGG